MNYVYEDVDTVVSEDDVKDDKVFPLVRELRFKYGLQVFNRSKSTTWEGMTKHHDYTLCNPMGVAIAKVWFDNNEEQFCYYTRYYEKSRGSDSRDRRTIRSKKLSSLMNTLKKCDVVPNDEKVLQTIMTDHAFAYGSSVATVRDAVGNDGKHNPFNVNEIQSMLEILLDGKSYDSLEGDIKNKMTQALDNYKDKDNIRKARQEEVERFFGSCYALFVDGLGQYVVGVIKYKEMDTGKAWTYDGFEVIKPFKRYKDIDALGVYPDLVSYLTMLKTYSENKNFEKFRGYVPSVNHFAKDLDMVINTTYTDGSEEFTTTQLYTPCSII